MFTGRVGQILAVGLILLVACVPLPSGTRAPNEEVLANAALLDFFDALHQGDYAAADRLYGGSYETLRDWNPDLDPGDHAALWLAACTRNGLQCLPVRSANLQTQTGNTFIFIVEFSALDGALFVLGPCCGADETEMPPQSTFEYTVTHHNGQFWIMDLPVYVP
ncbi:MAG: hypothetical protein JXB85_10540 [Anaerolineales bacterium]|nr:hypothetical protein [Anaerolineales bacterium]